MTPRNRAEAKGPGQQHPARRWPLWGHRTACPHYTPMNWSVTDPYTHLLQDNPLGGSKVTPSQAPARHVHRRNTARCPLAPGRAVRPVPSGPAPHSHRTGGSSVRDSQGLVSAPWSRAS